ncbi:hypothetical protein TNCV_4039881 [Trichonephila clavipes]|nr:hypothetical protein TNCV_4039881 [Trichonephila clavipes]
MPSPGFEPRPYGTAVSVANHFTGWRHLYLNIVCLKDIIHIVIYNMASSAEKKLKGQDRVSVTENFKFGESRIMELLVKEGDKKVCVLCSGIVVCRTIVCRADPRVSAARVQRPNVPPL